ncbi:hypothetical protein PCK1_000477 [Pneumocystis canis]|nr:hypothetical protein PCK1_000477 [Pneumocystis canis]
MDCRSKSSFRYLGWFKRMFRRIEDRRLEKKFRAGIQYSEYAMQTSSELMHTTGIRSHASTIVAHKYDENYVKKVQKELCDQISPSFQDVQKTQGISSQQDNVVKNRLSCSSYGLTGFSETRGVDAGIPIVPANEMSPPVFNNKHFHSVYRASMDTNASMRSLTPSSRQSSCSSFSSVLTVEKLGMFFSLDAIVVC